MKYTPAVSALVALAPLVGATDYTEPMAKQSSFQAFNLCVNVLGDQNSGPRFDPPIQDAYVNSLHVGAGLALAQVTLDIGRVFYQNGTAANAAATSIITDGGTPPFPEGLTVVPDDPAQPALATVHIDSGAGTPGLNISPRPGPELRTSNTTDSGQFLACHEPIPYYSGAVFTVIKHLTPATAPVPPECKAIQLFPKCTRLNDLPPGASSNHASVMQTECYF
ncbi:hypothetical protein GMORB2_3026 [Geosmithia morbida]|uniref:DUF7907 domain-containing protein n=1 Tax=Geosmithia morbida TaxID=1094350 RepID=A0A9P5CYM0_9HYPO|nr:uncharacterized protein GMORB2_3026 [Geosmithia morbida]KAF4120588.1 hypothetical protein GMORB2_3026 [Geosmithia morbida]